MSKNEKFRFQIEGINIKINTADQLSMIEQFKVLPFLNELVDLKNFDTYFKIILNEPDSQVYFGQKVASCRHNESSDDTFYSRYSLKKRPYLGPTSTDHELAFLMAN